MTQTLIEEATRLAAIWNASSDQQEREDGAMLDRLLDALDTRDARIAQLKAQLAKARNQHATVEAELTANERMVDTLQLSLRDAVSTATENARQRDAAMHQLAKAREAFRQIAAQDWTENALDPQWAARIAATTLAAMENRT